MDLGGIIPLPAMGAFEMGDVIHAKESSGHDGRRQAFERGSSMWGKANDKVKFQTFVADDVRSQSLISNFRVNHRAAI